MFLLKKQLLYQIDNFKSFYKNSFSYSWIKDLRKNIENFLKSDESLLFLDLLKILPDNKKLDLEVVIEIQKIITFCIHNGLLKSDQESCIEWNWFYCEISATISNFYLQSDLKGSRKEKYIYNLLSLYENFTEFKHKNYKAFSNIRCIELFKQYHNYRRL